MSKVFIRLKENIYEKLPNISEHTIIKAREASNGDYKLFTQYILSGYKTTIKQMLDPAWREILKDFSLIEEVKVDA